MEDHQTGRPWISLVHSIVPAPVLAMVIVAVLVTILVGCGASFGREEVVLSFSESNPSATPDQAECVADRLIDRYQFDQLQQELLAPELDPVFEEAQYRDMFACGLDGDVRTELEAQLIDSNVDSQDAACVADVLAENLTDDDIGVLLSGQSSDEFQQKFFEAMSGCGAIDPTE